MDTLCVLMLLKIGSGNLRDNNSICNEHRFVLTDCLSTLILLQAYCIITAAQPTSDGLARHVVSGWMQVKLNGHQTHRLAPIQLVQLQGSKGRGVNQTGQRPRAKQDGTHSVDDPLPDKHMVRIIHILLCATCISLA